MGQIYFHVFFEKVYHDPVDIALIYVYVSVPIRKDATMQGEKISFPELIDPTIACRSWDIKSLTQFLRGLRLITHAEDICVIFTPNRSKDSIVIHDV